MLMGLWRLIREFPLSVPPVPRRAPGTCPVGYTGTGWWPLSP